MPQPTPRSQIDLRSPKWFLKFLAISWSAMSSLVNGMTGLQQISIQGTPGSKATITVWYHMTVEMSSLNFPNACGLCLRYSGPSCFPMAYAGDPLGLALGTSLLVAVVPCIPKLSFWNYTLWGHDATNYFESDEEDCIGDIGAPPPALLGFIEHSLLAAMWHTCTIELIEKQ